MMIKIDKYGINVNPAFNIASEIQFFFFTVATKQQIKPCGYFVFNSHVWNPQGM